MPNFNKIEALPSTWPLSELCPISSRMGRYWCSSCKHEDLLKCAWEFAEGALCVETISESPQNQMAFTILRDQLPFNDYFFLPHDSSRAFS